MALACQVILLIAYDVLFINTAHAQTCMKRAEVIPQPLMDTRLVETAAESITSYSELNCIHRCYRVEGCHGINTRIGSKDSTICEIFTTQGSSGPRKLASSKGWKHYNLKVKRLYPHPWEQICSTVEDVQYFWGIL